MNNEINEIKPLADFSDYGDAAKRTPYDWSLVSWAGVLDCRFGIEIVRVAPHNGTLRIFDLENDDKLLVETETKISYDAKFGPDHYEVMCWQDEAADWVDNNIYNKE